MVCVLRLARRKRGGSHEFIAFWRHRCQRKIEHNNRLTVQECIRKNVVKSSQSTVAVIIIIIVIVIIFSSLLGPP